MALFWLRRTISRLMSPSQKAQIKQYLNPPATQEILEAIPIPSNLGLATAALRQTFGNSSDLVVREFFIGTTPPVRAALCYFEELINRDQLENNVLKSLMLFPHTGAKAQTPPLLHLVTFLKDHLLTSQKVTAIHNLDEAVKETLRGNAVLIVDTCSEALSIAIPGAKARAVEEPKSETIVRGPREGFNEELGTNIALIRRKLQTPNLRVEKLNIGRVTNTSVALMYIEGIVNSSVLAEVHRRLDRIATDAILDSGYLEEFIEDSPFSPFPQVNNTERPDRVAGHLLEGRVAILVNGSPFALTVPAIALEFFISPEDYYTRVHITILVRGIRLVSFFITLLLPSLYVALTTFHQEMIPTPLALAIAAGREAIPVPAWIEALFMMLAFEILREAGVRMPRDLGQAISIVGALVIGQAAVSAGLVSPLMIIVVALTAIGSFVTPNVIMVNATRILSYFFVLLAATLGLFGITWGLLLLTIHLVQLRSFGIPYMAPYAPMIPQDLKDTITRLHHWAMDTRPMSIAPEENLTRQQQGNMPWPNQQGNPPEKGPPLSYRKPDKGGKKE